MGIGRRLGVRRRVSTRMERILTTLVRAYPFQPTICVVEPGGESVFRR